MKPFLFIFVEALSMKLAFVLPSLLLLSIVACKKPTADSHADQFLSKPFIVYTSLEDSLPKKTMEALQLGRVTGIKVKYPQDGHNVRYFEYEADATVLIHEISKLPFEKYAAISDTFCRSVDGDHLKLSRSRVSDTELNASSSFWNADLNAFDIYECIKSPAKHSILISRTSKKIFHRIEYEG
jgi:hypothetical protein